jgi:hypothetical protein
MIKSPLQIFGQACVEMRRITLAPQDVGIEIASFHGVNLLLRWCAANGPPSCLRHYGAAAFARRWRAEYARLRGRATAARQFSLADGV